MQIYIWVSLIVLLLVIGIFKILLERKPTLHYKREENLLNNSELSFYKFLLSNIPSDILVMCKVRLADIVSPVEKGRNFYKAFNQVRSKHIDFVFIDKTTSEIKALIELNGKSHLSGKRIRRDSFITDVFADVKLPLFFVNVRSEYSLEDIKSILDFIQHSW